MKSSVRPGISRHEYFELFFLHLQPTVNRQPGYRREDREVVVRKFDLQITQNTHRNILEWF